ncbi:MAG TPA: hypothetical protein VMH81_11820 [Bryobacteraceae bacterium]|nr:hypothetical protein [Bryobacteraceae bacterium]
MHNLRQPLGTIETSVCVLNLLLRDARGEVPEHLRVIERQVELAARTLDEAAAELRRLRAGEAAETRRALAESAAVVAG